MSDILAPIVLFTYNRPDHTLQTLQALKKNHLASDSKLYIYCDGAPKKNESPYLLQKIAEVKDITKSNQWCAKVEIIERETNFGLAKNIVSGVTEIINQYGKVIVLEDDIITSSGFLSYMNDALELYKNDDQVMNISGYSFPTDTIMPETYFCNLGSCWGWGTDAKSWSKYIDDPKYVWSYLQDKNLFQQYNFKYGNYSNQLRQNIKGIKKTWAIKWYSTLFLCNGLCLHPGISLVKNIGMDDSGTNSNKSNFFDITNLAESIQLEKIPIKTDLEHIKIFETYFYNKNKLKYSVIDLLRPLLPQSFLDTPYFN